MIKAMNFGALIFLNALLAFSCSHSNKNNSDLVADSTDCNKGRLEAKADIEKGIFGRYFFGLPTDQFQTYVRHVKNKYAIEIKGGGDIINDLGTCYNEIMDDHFKRKFGNAFFTRVQIEVDSIKNKELGDRQASYLGGSQALESFIACNIKIPLKGARQKVYVDLNIDSTGRVESAVVRRSVDRAYDSEALRVSELLSWEPAIENQKHVSTRMTIAVVFDSELKRRIKCK